jgi:hypothetical protein
MGAAAGVGICAVVAVALSAAGPGGVTLEVSAQAAGPNGPDGGVLSSFVAHAQRGEVEPPDLDDVEHMCALLTSCDKLPIPSAFIPADFQACVKSFTEELSSPAAIYFSLTMRECGLQSSSCASLRSCALHGVNPDACQGRGRQSAAGLCDVDGRALTCWHDQVLAVRDCGRGGEQCIVAGGDAKCVLGPCPGSIKDGDDPTCSASGTHKLQCEKGKLVSLDCAAFGLKCTTGADGAAGCATGGPLCTGTARRCDGTSAIGCFNGHEVRVDCANAGLSCALAPGSVPVGACVSTPPTTGACNPGAQARCDGANIKYCLRGTPRSYFCKALGFTTCDGAKGARCSL